MQTCKIRLATQEDCDAMLGIYAPYIQNTAVSFENTVPEPHAFCRRFLDFTRQFPWLVCETDGGISGYCYAHRFAERAAYDWSVECSIYLHEACHGRRIGTALFSALLDTLRLQGYCNAYSLVALPNPQSEGLHKAFGFNLAGTLQKVGYKYGEWHDVGYYALSLRDYPENPQPPKPIGLISGTRGFEAILEKSAGLIRL
jgi:phosphinothricin acetyltransferase